MLPVNTKDDMHFRHELKYEVSDTALRMLESRLRGVMITDPNAGEDGTYRIRSLYFDDVYESAFSDNDSGVGHRRKYRIRIYNGSMDRISLEKKSKLYDKIRKVSCLLTREQYEILADPGADKRLRDDMPDLMKEVLALYHERRLEPRIIVEYLRRPYIYRDGNVRITLDMGVTSCADLQSFSQPQIYGRPIMPPGRQLLEVKFDEFLPDHIYRTVAMPGLSLTTYSKYYLCRRFSTR